MTAWLSERPTLVLAAVMVLTLPLAAGLARLEIRTDGEALHPPRDPAVVAAALDRGRFRDPDAVLVLLQPRERGAGLFTPAGLARLRSLTAALRSVPGVQSDGVTSLATIVDVAGSARSIRLRRVLDPPPEDDGAASRLRARLRGSRLYEGLLYGRDGRSATLFVPLSGSEPRGRVVERIRRAATERAGADFRVLLAGPVVAEALLGEQVIGDLRRLVPLVVTVVAGVLFVCLRSPTGTFVPLVQMLCVLTWTFGLMGWLRVPLTLVSSILPVLLMAMAMSDQIHLHERFLEHRRRGLAPSAAVERSLAEVGPAIAKSAISTALGFLAFTTASVPALRHFGIFAALGFVLSMVLSYTLVPALMLVLHRRRPGQVTVPSAGPAEGARAGRPGPGADTEAPPVSTRHAGGAEVWVAARSGPAAVAAVAVIVAAALGWPRLVVQDSWVQNFSPRSDLVIAEHLLDAQYEGSYRMDVVLEGAAQDFFVTARGVRVVDSLEAALGRFPEVGGTLSWLDLAETALRGVDSTRTLLALDDAAVAGLEQVLEMTGSQDRLEQLLPPSKDRVRIMCFVPDADYRKASRLLARLDSLAGRSSLPPGLQVRASGSLPVAAAVVRATVANQVRSVAWAFVGLGILLSISFRSVPLAAAMLVPVAGTTIALFGGMGYAGVPLGVATSMIAALAEGEGTNFAVHVVSRFQIERRSSPARGALLSALRGAGPAVRWNALALVAGCSVLCLSALRPVRSLGVLLAAGLTLSYVLTMLVLPALLLALDRAASGRGKSFGAAGRSALAGPGLVMLLAGLGLVVPLAASPAVAARRSAAARAPGVPSGGPPGSSTGVAPGIPFPGAPAASPAGAPGIPFADQPSARRIMADIERSQRQGARLFSMDVTLSFPGHYTTHRRMLGVASSDSQETRLLYVVTSPQMFRGSALLIREPAAPGTRARMWVHLPAFRAFREIEASYMSLLVPGTGFTYDDSRGWIPADRYRFRKLSRGPKGTLIEAVPRNDSLADVAGSARLQIRVDAVRQTVNQVVFYDRAGNPVRSYEAKEFVEVAGRWYPARVRTHQGVQLLDAEIVYRYADLPVPPPADLFRPSEVPTSFLERLAQWRDRSGFATAFPDSTGPP